MNVIMYNFLVSISCSILFFAVILWLMLFFVNFSWHDGSAPKQSSEVPAAGWSGQPESSQCTRNYCPAAGRITNVPLTHTAYLTDQCSERVWWNHTPSRSEPTQGRNPSPGQSSSTTQFIQDECSATTTRLTATAGGVPTRNTRHCSPQASQWQHQSWCQPWGVTWSHTFTEQSLAEQLYSLHKPPTN